MTTEAAGDADTQITASSDDRRSAILVHGLRAAAYRITADCERVLDGLDVQERERWQSAFGEALIAGRELLALAGKSIKTVGETLTRTLTARIRDPQRRIVDAMTLMLRHVPVSTGDELLLLDARAIRQAAVDLLAFNDAARGGAGSNGRTRREEPASPRAEPAKTPRVLVVDDDRLLRTLLSKVLTRLGYEVVLAENGKEALEVAERESVDLILTDINMPKLDGISLLRMLKTAARTRDVPVIVVSSQDDLASVTKCIELGAEDHITKPYEPLVLQARVRASLERKRMRDLELDYLRRVAELTAAAEAVEREAYVAGSLAGLTQHDDGLGQLARVFDRMVTGLKSRETRLQQRLRQLRHEMGEASGQTGAVANVSVESPFASGEILAARYEILGQLGKGGMGMVYHARDMELGEEIAVKVVRRDLVHRDPTLVDRLKSEIRLARKISHRNVMRAHDMGEWSGTFFITMEFVKGITVAELLDRRGRLSVESTLAIGTQLAEALTVAHEQNIIHRDIKPANLLVDEAGVLKVMDFGLARFIETDASLTAGGFIVGTPQYMAPEQLMGGQVDARSDLFAVGVALYECLAGKPPFVGETPLALVAQILDGHVEPLDRVAPDVPHQLAMIVRQLLNAQAADRIGSARELASRLAEAER